MCETDPFFATGNTSLAFSSVNLVPSCQPPHTAGVCLLTAFWACTFFHPDRMIYSNDLFWRGLLNPSSPPRSSIRSVHTTADDPGPYLPSLQQGCYNASTAASSPEPLRPCGHPESPTPAGAQCCSLPTSLSTIVAAAVFAHPFQLSHSLRSVFPCPQTLILRELFEASPCSLRGSPRHSNSPSRWLPTEQTAHLLSF